MAVLTVPLPWGLTSLVLLLPTLSLRLASRIAPRIRLPLLGAVLSLALGGIRRLLVFTSPSLVALPGSGTPSAPSTAIAG